MLCPGRNRAPAATSGTAGPFTDYSINTWVNDPLSGNEEAADSRRAINTIPDGSSNTIFLGHKYMSTVDYTKTVGDTDYLGPIFESGDEGTGIQQVDGNSTDEFKRDSPIPSGGCTPSSACEIWGGPFPQGGLFAVADGTVRLIRYGTDLSRFLFPNDGFAVTFPD
jgi:hypothetical protein